MNFKKLYLSGSSIDTISADDAEEDDKLPVYRVTGDDSDDDDDIDSEGGVRVTGAPYFISVHQLVEVMEYDTAILECAVTNIDSSVTVSILKKRNLKATCP